MFASNLIPGIQAKALSKTIYFKVSKMANFASVALHPPTVGLWQYGTGQTPTKLKIATWNVNGLRSIIKKGELQNFMKNYDPDILCINETKMDLKAFDRQSPTLKKQFNQYFKFTQNERTQDKKFGHWFYYFNFCKVSSGYSGVLTLSKYQPKQAIQDFPQIHHMQLEGRCLTLDYQKFYLINCYKPNSGNALQRLSDRTKIYDKTFSQYINGLRSKKHVVVCGDMNVAHNQIDLARPKNNKKNAGFTPQQRKAFNDFLQENRLIDSYRHLNPNKVEYTWWRTRARARETNTGWRIDYILVTQPKMVQKSEIFVNVMGSDHCPVQSVINL